MVEFTKEQEAAARAVGRALERARIAGLSLRIGGGWVALMLSDAPDTPDGEIDPEYCISVPTRIGAHGGA